MRDVTEVIIRGGYPAEAAADCVLLDHDMRVRRRIVFTTAAGESVRLAQAEVVQLRDGDGLKLDDGRIVRVRAQPEALLEIIGHDAAELTRLAWHLGNRHLPTQFLPGALRIRYDHVIAGMVEALGGRWKRIDAPFDPEGGAYGHAGGHRHDHDEPHHHHRQGEGEGA